MGKHDSDSRWMPEPGTREYDDLEYRGVWPTPDPVIRRRDIREGWTSEAIQAQRELEIHEMNRGAVVRRTGVRFRE